MLEAAIRIHHSEEAFERGLLQYERPCKTSNQCSHDYDGVHFLVLLTLNRAIGVPFCSQCLCQELSGTGGAEVLFEEGMPDSGRKLRRAGEAVGEHDYGEMNAVRCGPYPLFDLTLSSWLCYPRPQFPVSS